MEKTTKRTASCLRVSEVFASTFYPDRAIRPGFRDFDYKNKIRNVIRRRCEEWIKRDQVIEICRSNCLPVFWQTWQQLAGRPVTGWALARCGARLPSERRRPGYFSIDRDKIGGLCPTNKERTARTILSSLLRQVGKDRNINRKLCS